MDTLLFCECLSLSLLQPSSGDAPAVDTAEQVYISSLALLKVRTLAYFTFYNNIFALKALLNVKSLKVFNVLGLW